MKIDSETLIAYRGLSDEEDEGGVVLPDEELVDDDEASEDEDEEDEDEEDGIEEE